MGIKESDFNVLKYIIINLNYKFSKDHKQNQKCTGEYYHAIHNVLQFAALVTVALQPHVALKSHIALQLRIQTFAVKDL
jgi:hypothetical protein